MTKKISKATRKAARKRKEAELREDTESRQYARQLLRAHFAEDRNEFLTGEDIRIIGEDRGIAGRTGQAGDSRRMIELRTGDVAQLDRASGS